MLVLRRQSTDFKNVRCFEELNVRTFLVYEYKVATMEPEDLLVTMTLTLPVGPLVGAETFARPMCARTVSWITTLALEMVQLPDKRRREFVKISKTERSSRGDSAISRARQA